MSIDEIPERGDAYDQHTELLVAGSNARCQRALMKLSDDEHPGAIFYNTSHVVG